MKEQINKLLSIGATGTVNHFFQWLRMLRFLNQETLPEKFADFQSQYENHLKNYESNLIPDEIEESKVREILENLIESKAITDQNSYKELSLADPTALNFENNEVTLFSAVSLDYEPIQLIRSVLVSYCKKNAIDDEVIDELAIAITEAVENAVKYSDSAPIITTLKCEDNILEIRILNSVPTFDLEREIEKGKFSHDFSLMRGVLVMSRLLDSIDIQEDEGLARVELIGRKKLV